MKMLNASAYFKGYYLTLFSNEIRDRHYITQCLYEYRCLLYIIINFVETN